MMTTRSNRDVELLGKGAGYSADFWLKFTRAMSAIGGTPADVQRIATNPESEPLIRQMAELAVNGPGSRKEQALSEVYLTEIGPELSGPGPFRRMVEKGQFSSHDPGFDEMTFQQWIELSVAVANLSHGTQEFRLFHVGNYFGEDQIDTKLILSACRGLGLNHRGIRELLDFAIQHPDEQRKFPIAALGSACYQNNDQLNGELLVPTLVGSEVERELQLELYERTLWPPSTRLLVSAPK